MYGFGFLIFLRHWIIAAAAPRIAGDDAFEGEPSALEGAVFPDGLEAVVRAGGRVAAGSSDEGRQGHLIELDQPDHHRSQRFAEQRPQFPHLSGCSWCSDIFRARWPTALRTCSKVGSSRPTKSQHICKVLSVTRSNPCFCSR